MKKGIRFVFIFVFLLLTLTVIETSGFKSAVLAQGTGATNTPEPAATDEPEPTSQPEPTPNAYTITVTSSAPRTPVPQPTDTPAPEPVAVEGPCGGCDDWHGTGCEQYRECRERASDGICYGRMDTRNICEDNGGSGGGNTPVPPAGGATPTPTPIPTCSAWSAVNISLLPGTGELQTQSGYLSNNNTVLAQAIWRGNQGWIRTVPVGPDGYLDTANASAWSGPSNISGIPGTGDMQSTENFLIRNGAALFQSVWRGNQGWTREVPVVNGSPNFSSAGTWAGPTSIDELPGAGDLQTYSVYFTDNGSVLNEGVWRGNQGWVRAVPVSNGVPQYAQAPAWKGPSSIGGVPGSGLMQTTNIFPLKNGEEIRQGVWRGNQGWVRTVKMLNGKPQFSSCPPNTPVPSTTLTPPTVNPPIPACSTNGWSATFGWTKSADPRANTYVLRINKNNDWMNSLTNTLWYLNDGSDQWTLTGNVANKKRTIIPFRQYFEWSVQSASSGDVDSWKPNAGSLAQGSAFTCFPAYQAPTGGACLDAEGFLTAGCTIDNFRTEYRRQYGYTQDPAQGTGPNPNLVTGANAYKAVLTDANTAKKEIVDLLDFELWRKKSHLVRPPTPTPTAVPPTAVPPPTSTPAPNAVRQLELGGSHSCFITIAGGVKCWGWNELGQLGDGTVVDKKSPVDVTGLQTGVTNISAYEDHSCVVTSTGGAKCWGWNNVGQLGDGTFIDKKSPEDVVGFQTGVKTISAGLEHSCIVTPAGGVKCWGENANGQIGDGTLVDKSSPVDVVGLQTGVTSIFASFDHTCALTSAGGVKCWGRNNRGQLGDGTIVSKSSPVDVVGLQTGVTSIFAADSHTCVLTSAGGVKCWGRNDNGQLGDGTLIDKSSPVDVIGLQTGVTSISAGYHHYCALKVNGGVKCWGWNDHGQLGDGTLVDKSSPVDVIGLQTGVTSISAGGRHSCILTTAGGVKCWGWNQFGQLGDGTLVDKLSPVAVVGLP